MGDVSRIETIIYMTVPLSRVYGQDSILVVYTLKFLSSFFFFIAFFPVRFLALH